MSKPRARTVGKFNLNAQPRRTLATEVAVPAGAGFYLISGREIRFYPAVQEGSLPQGVLPLPEGIAGSIIFVYTASRRGGYNYRVTAFPVNPHLLRVYGMKGVSATEAYIEAASNGGLDHVIIPWINPPDLRKIAEYHEYWVREMNQLPSS